MMQITPDVNTTRLNVECIISVKGRGAARRQPDGMPLCDETRKIHDAIIDAKFWYEEVFNHVKFCDKCDPEEILKIYLSRRMCEKFNFKTSRLLIDLALKYEKFGKEKGRPLDKDLINEFILKSERSFLVGKYEDRIPFEDLKNFVRSKIDDAELQNAVYKPAFKKIKLMTRVFKTQGREFFRLMDEKQFQDMEIVHDLHNT